MWGLRLILFDADDLRPPGDYTVAAHRGECLSHRILSGRISNENNRDRLPRASALVRRQPRDFVALHNRLQRNLLLRQAPRNGRGAARPVAGKKADIIATLMALHRRPANGGTAAGGAAKRRRT